MDNYHNCQCQCGKTQFKITGKPLMRGFCHCSVCQRFNQAAFADVTLFRAKDITTIRDESVEFNTNKLPPIVARGTCTVCNKPAIEQLKMFPLPKIVIMPSANIQDMELLPESSMHIFYETRVADIQDELPKHQGYMKSQLTFGSKLLRALFTK